ncbi:MAG: glucose 1-dehydrogenase [Acidobacteria bacterium]|nr:glucose 1-dehydrogenase [Acidobacteriota bacterium]
MIDLKEKVVLITGASRGIGAASALLFAEAGAKVIINYNTNLQKARTVAKRIEKIQDNCEVTVIKADVSDKASVSKMFAKIRDKFGRLDILVNNAGIWQMAPIISITDEELRATIETNFIGTVNCIREAANLMRENGTGVIVNVSSTAARRGEAFYSHYSSSKAALHGLTKSLAVELAPYNIRVNAIAPGWVNTDMSKKAIQEKGSKIREKIPLGRIAEPEDIAGPILFLCSDLARFVNGAILDVNGGSVLVD